MENINVEEIMKQIREDIKQKGYKISDLSFDDIKINDSNDIKAM